MILKNLSEHLSNIDARDIIQKAYANYDPAHDDFLQVLTVIAFERGYDAGKSES
jgi:hypothetical protein